MYSVPGSNVSRSEGPFRPQVHSISNTIVKKEPVEARAPCSPTFWGDFKSLEGVDVEHEAYVHKQKNYTPMTMMRSTSDIPSCSGVKQGNTP